MTRDEMLSEVYTSHYPLLRFLAARIVGYQDCQDVIQTAFLKVLRNRTRFVEPADAKRYVARAVVNAALDAARKRTHESVLEKAAADPDRLASACLPSDPLQLLIDAHQARDRKALFDGILSAADRLCKEKGVPSNLIWGATRGALTAFSNIHGTPISTMKSRQSAVVKELRLMLRQ